MAPEDVALLFMAGGQSRRFGNEDKLRAELHGRPLARHVAERLAVLPWAWKIAVAGGELQGDLQAMGYEVVVPLETNGLGDNIALAARHVGMPVATLITLADMPFVTVAHIEAMLAAATSTRAIVCTQGQSATTPPTLMGQAHFTHLLALSGDEGAKSVVRAAGEDVITVVADDTLIADIDTRADLEKWRDRQA